MATAYYKRYRMEADLSRLPPVPIPPMGYGYLGWRNTLIGFHADVKYRSFRWEVERATLSLPRPEIEGCTKLMEEITQRPEFSPAALRWHFAIWTRSPNFAGPSKACAVRMESETSKISEFCRAPGSRRRIWAGSPGVARVSRGGNASRIPGSHRRQSFGLAFVSPAWLSRYANRLQNRRNRLQRSHPALAG